MKINLKAIRSTSDIYGTLVARSFEFLLPDGQSVTVGCLSTELSKTKEEQKAYAVARATLEVKLTTVEEVNEEIIL